MYYMGGGESDHPVFVQSDQSNQSHVKSPGGSRAVWVLALITVVCQAVAAVEDSVQVSISRVHPDRSTLCYFFSVHSRFRTLPFSPFSHLSATGTKASNAPITVIQVSDVSSIASSPPQQFIHSTSPPSSNPPGISSAILLLLQFSS